MQSKLEKSDGDAERYKAEAERLTRQANQTRDSERDLEIARLEKEIDRLRAVEEAGSKLKKNYVKLQQSYSNLRRDFTNQLESKMRLRAELEQLSGELSLTNENNRRLVQTKAWKAVNFWWDGKRRVATWIPQKQSRFAALYGTSRYMWETQGLAALANRLYCFLKGERKNINLYASEDSVLPPPPEINEAIDAEAIYERWIEENEPSRLMLEFQIEHQRVFEYNPLVSIITPVYNTDHESLEKMIQSVLNQTYSNWELCIADGGSTEPSVRRLLEDYSERDSRVKVKFLDANLGIAGNSNAAFETANGEFAALLDHDDELSADALYENVVLLNGQPDADLIYSDEDKLDETGARCEPFFKPDWSPDLFRSAMYTCHLGVYRTDLIKKVGGFRSGFDGAQDYDLMLRLIEQTDKIFHIPKVLYHWRKTANSTASSLDAKDYAKSAQIRAVAEHVERLNLQAEVVPGLADNLLRVRRIISDEPKVSIIIPTCDQTEYLSRCIESIRNLSTYSNYEIIVVNNNSRQSETLEYFEKISAEPEITVLDYPHRFNFSAINNFAAGRASGELLLFLNNDTEVISPEWLEAMVEHGVRPEVGAVGARLLYPNNMVQHAGVIIGIGGIAGHSHKYLPAEHPGYFSRAKAIQNVSAVTAACMLVRTEVFKSLGGFNEENLAVAFNDVDLCLRIRENRLLIIYTPYAELYHYESLSRGADETLEKAMRFKAEAEYMLEKWNETLRCDPYYSPHLSLTREDFSIAVADK